MIQIIIVCILVLLGIYCFKVYPLERRNTKKLAFSALIIIITLILKRLTIMVPLFGAESLKIGFEYIPVMLVGVILSPSYTWFGDFPNRISILWIYTQSGIDWFDSIIDCCKSEECRWKTIW